ncbi:MAG: hypothetical protein PHO15_03930 [Eubacteriales bacterium]|nr:hypothetical protein [Eubacteriales bacterium]
MIPCVIGYEEHAAAELLSSMGFCVSRIEYISKRGVEDADSARVIRQRVIGNNSIEITVSYFKTKMRDDTGDSKS